MKQRQGNLGCRDPRQGNLGCRDPRQGNLGCRDPRPENHKTGWESEEQESIRIERPGTQGPRT